MSVFAEALVFGLFLAKRVARGWGKVRRTRWQPNIVVVVLECSLFTLLFVWMPFIDLLDHLFEQLLVSFYWLSSRFPRKAADFYSTKEEHLSHRLELETYLSKFILKVHVLHFFHRSSRNGMGKVSSYPRVCEGDFSGIPVNRFELSQPRNKILAELRKLGWYFVPRDALLLPDFGFEDRNRVSLAMKGMFITDQFKECNPEGP